MIERERKVKLPSGLEVTLRRFSFNDLFLFLKIIEKALESEVDLDSEVGVLKLVSRLHIAKAEIEELLKSITDVENIESLTVEDLIFIVKEVFKQEKLLDFFEQKKNAQE
jgi:hypothetical protein